MSRTASAAMYKTEPLLNSLARNEFTLLVFDRTGEIVETKSLKEAPSPEDVERFRAKYKGKAFRFVSKGVYSHLDLQEMVAAALEAFDLAEKGLLRPGANPL